MAATPRNGFAGAAFADRSGPSSWAAVPIPSIETLRVPFVVHRRAVAGIRSVTASTGIGEVVTLAPSAPAIVTGVTTQRPAMMRSSWSR
jgi:hypothetical protein